MLCNAEGYPAVVPIIQVQAAKTDKIVFAVKPYTDMLRGLEKGAKVAVESVSMQMESVLEQGVFLGLEKGFACVQINMVYNSMPSIFGYIYPEEPYKEVTNF